MTVIVVVIPGEHNHYRAEMAEDFMQVISYGETNTGNKRLQNEDAFLIDDGLRLFLVADSCGDTQTAPAILQRIASYLNETQLSSPAWPLHLPDKTLTSQRLTSAIKLANEEAIKFKLKGTAFAGLWLVGDTAFIVHVGDCRVYRWRNNMLEQLTEDHTLLNDYLKMGKLTPQEIEEFPHKNVIVRALAMKHDIQVDIATHHARPEELFLLCTDGLYNDLTVEEIAQILQTSESLEAACHQMIQTADRNRGSDNATVILVRC